MKTRFLTLAAILLSASLSFADNKASVNSTDEKFIKETAADSTAEVKIAELATKKAERADVKEFAQMLITDHTAANKELEAVAQKKGVDLSAVIAPSAAKDFQNLEKYSGKDFDNEFLKLMETDHKKCVSNFESEAKKVEDGDLKDFVNKTLPVIKAHYDKVQGLRK
jgi:putative membrane protein